MRFFFDNNIGPNIPKGLCAFGEEACHLVDHFDPDTPDEVWLEFVGRQGMCLVTRDDKIRRRPAELEALRRHNVGAFFLAGKKMGRWDQIRQIIRAWTLMKDAASKTRPPYAFRVNASGSKVVRLEL